MVVALAVRVRRCDELDLAALEWYGMFTSHREIIRDAYRRQLAGENEMLIGELAGTPVAQLWIDLTKRRDQHIGAFWALRVFPILRGLGLGTTLLARGEDWLRERGYHQAEIGVETDNPRAQQLYERLGYRVVTSVREPYTYRRPDGTLINAIADQRVLRKPLR
ncbi:MAG TPA: GNAT family N-acetyltransferase [Kofleriaceae bacterium]|nr:GNAT family N-acetyltransferase [Kofleriaceae bacterium]